MEILQRRLKTMDIKAKAKELGIEITDEMTDDEIKALVEAKEEELKNKNKDPEYLENELKKVIAQRDAAKKERRALQNKIKEFVEDRISSKSNFERSFKEIENIILE